MSTTKKINNKNLSRLELEKVAILFRIFGDATRLQILQFLKNNGECHVGEMVEKLNINQSNLSKQLKIMKEAKIIFRRQEGVQVFYTIADPLALQMCSLVCEKLDLNG